MANRREFIQASMAVAGMTAPVAQALAAPRALPLYKVVYDERSVEARAFGREAERGGVAVQAIGSSVHALWHDDLYHRWRTTRSPVAGMTGYNALFLLAMMAEDADMRVIYRAHHRPLAQGGGYAHEQFGPAAALGVGTLPAISGAGWATAAAERVVRWPASEVTVARRRSNIARANQRQLDGDALVSWIIAPVRRGAHV